MSLIAFPHFQTFPSRVHKVKHSPGTLMLIDIMQRLQGLVSFPEDDKPGSTSSLRLVLHYENDEALCLGPSKPVATTKLDEDKKANGESFLFLSSSDNESCSRHTMRSNVISVNCLELDCCHSGIQSKDFIDITPQDGTFSDLSKDQEETCEGDETIPETPIAKRSVSNKGDNAGQMVNLVEIEISSLVADACINGMKDEELSPRLTNFIRSGVVPESPVDERGKSRFNSVIHECMLPVHLHQEQDVSSLSPWETEKVLIDRGTNKNACTSPVVNETQTSLLELKNLMKHFQIVVKCLKALNLHANLKGERKSTHNVRDFIEEEAEVSLDSFVSNDEDDEDGNSFDSFIDDRTNPTAASQLEASRLDMMAIYRRSLLSQTPSNGGLGFSATFTPDSVTMAASISESEDSSGKTVNHLHTEPTKQSVNPTSESVKIRSRKRRLSFYHSGHFPNMNLDREFALQSKKETVDADVIVTTDVLYDDQFYNDLDLDELEAQATSLLKRKLDLSIQKQDTVPQSHTPNLDIFRSPSFDLGIERHDISTDAARHLHSGN
uniref:Uncharacterized protein n=1 Tax=Cajanus cajan TaxID=3821 RepID=A0A151TLG7_CAJCA|nr:hypothetical protein KK1_021503 [Cajanus cajan]